MNFVSESRLGGHTSYLRFFVAFFLPDFGDFVLEAFFFEGVFALVLFGSKVFWSPEILSNAWASFDRVSMIACSAE